MLPILKALTGYRDDLNLRSHWWHRLFNVAFVLAMLAGTALVLTLAPGVAPSVTTIRVITTLPEFTRQRGREWDNTVPDFARSEGDTGQVMPGQEGTVRPLSAAQLKTIECAVARSTYVDSEGKKELDRYIDLSDLPDAGRQVPDTAGAVPERGLCLVMFPSDLESLETADSIVKYTVRPWAQVRRALWLTFAMGVAAVAAMNLYYRGFIYVVKGPRVGL